jgi:protocatechuate 3,4-dioxygenase beta subunit
MEYLTSLLLLLGLLALSLSYGRVGALPAGAGFRSPLMLAAAEQPKTGESCPPTEADALGPFYKPGATERASVGRGYVLSGVVKSAGSCASIAGARLEFWLAGPDGNYDDDHRATLFVDETGAYRFESNFPPQYSFRPPHIHLRVTAKGYRTLVTQHYPVAGQTQGTFDLVLAPVR